MNEASNKRRFSNKVLVIILGFVVAGSLVGVSSVSAGLFLDSVYVTPHYVLDYVKADGGTIPVEKQFIIGGDTISGQFDVETMVFTEGSTISGCLDDFGNPVVQVVPAFPTTGLTLSGDLVIDYTETTGAYPGSYHCDVIFKITNNEFTGSDTQTSWIDVVGSPGFWKNNGEVTTGHLPITLGSSLTGYDVETLSDAEMIYDNNSAKNALNKLAANLLTAKLNLWALMDDGANCDTYEIHDKVEQADQALIDAEYNGPDGSPVVKGKDKGPFLDLAEMLDMFNNAQDECNNN